MFQEMLSRFSDFKFSAGGDFKTRKPFPGNIRILPSLSNELYLEFSAQQGNNFERIASDHAY